MSHWPLSQLLGALGSLPEVEAEVLASRQEIAHALERRRREWHGCTLCPSRSKFAFVAGPGVLTGPPRYLDLCAACAGAVCGVFWEWPEDEDLLDALEKMAEDGLIRPL